MAVVVVVVVNGSKEEEPLDGLGAVVLLLKRAATKGPAFWLVWLLVGGCMLNRGRGGPPLFF